MTKERLIELVAECLERMEDEGERALDDVCAREPELADLLRVRVARLRTTGMLEPPSLAAGVPERVGDFDLVRRIASGGMGVVYEGYQRSVGRRVAVKLVRPEMLYFPGARERFRREIEAVARLSHPGIATVYHCGEEGELPYFAMEYVAGASLSDALGALHGRTPSTLTGADLLACTMPSDGAPNGEPAGLFAGDWATACTRVVREACLVVQHAHTAGVLHRDLKPGNVLVTAAGRVVVVDFGLAWLEGASLLTRTGAMLGSLPYMAPEQLRGDARAITAATDVFGLGVTLYELLALRRPFDGESASQLEHAIAFGQPRDLRAANRAVSRDLETVVLCALDAEPARRYPTPAALAEDLACVLDGRPVAARRLGPVARAWRSARRRPARAFALVGAPLLTAAALSGWWASRAGTAQAESSEAIARAHFDIAVDAVTAFAAQGGEQPVQRGLALIETAEAAYEELEAALGDGTSLAGDRAMLERLRADLLEQLGRRTDAADAYRAAADSAQRMLATGASPRIWRAHAADVLSRLGGVLQRKQQWQEALAAFDEAIELAAPALREQPEDPIGARAWAAAEVNRAQLLRLTGELEEARAGFERATPVLEAQRAAAPEDAHAQDVLGLCYSGQAQVEWRAGARDRAFELWRRAIEALEQAHHLDSTERIYLDDLGTTCSHYGRALVQARRLDVAESVLQQARAHLEELVARHPESPDLRQALMQALDSTGLLLLRLERPVEAVAYYRRAVSGTEELVASYPDTVAFLLDLPVTLNNCSLAENAAGNRVEALECLRRATQIYESFPDELAPGGALVEQAKWSFVGHAEVALAAGAVDEAMRLLERTEGLESPDPEVWHEVAKQWLGVHSRAPGTRAPDGAAPAERAVAALRRAVELGWRDAAELESGEGWAALRGTPAFEALRLEAK
jgi:serine/threonine protein kinase/tetratricopeptide (TPR) repeat protein